jgi:radical SAM superfamily enzyme YgiQ (UPF0313 family)
MESIDTANLKDVNKSFNKPNEYAGVLDRLAKRNIYAITSFIFGLDNDTPGVADRTIDHIKTWPPGLPVFGMLTPFPSTPLYKRLMDGNRLTRPKHWLDYAPYKMAHNPLKITIDQTHAELTHAWEESYSPRRNMEAMQALADQPIRYRMTHLVMRLLFRGIYFPQMNKRAFMKVVLQNRAPILALTKETLSKLLTSRKTRKRESGQPAEVMNERRAA